MPYTEADIASAIIDVTEDLSIRKASLKWGIPRMTLSDCLIGAVSRKTVFQGL